MRACSLVWRPGSRFQCAKTLHLVADWNPEKETHTMTSCKYKPPRTDAFSKEER